jgi:hypothetical protein
VERICSLLGRTFALLIDFWRVNSYVLGRTCLESGWFFSMLSSLLKELE